MSTKDLKKLLGDSVLTYFAKVLVAFSAILFQMFLSKSLSTEAFGDVTKWIVYINYFVVVLSLGLDVSLIYYAKKKLINTLRGLFKNIVIYLVVFCIALLILFFSQQFSLENFLLITAIFSVTSITSINAIYQVKDDFKSYNLHNILLYSSIVLVGLLVYLNLVPQKSLYIKSLYTVCLFSFFGFLLIRLLLFHTPNTSVIKSVGLHEYFQFGLKGVLINLMGQTLYFSDVFILSLFVSDSQIGKYIVAGTLVKVSWFIADSMGIVIFPKFSGDITDKVKILFLKYLTQTSLFLTFFQILLFAYFGRTILTLLYDPAFTDSYLLVLILLFGSHGIVLYKLFSRYYLAIGKFNIIYIALAFSIILNVGLNFILIPHIGILGAAYSSLIAYWTCGLVFLFYRRESPLDYLSVNLILKEVKIYSRKFRNNKT